MTPRAIATLRNVDIIAAEDTRNTRKLLTHFNISGKELLAYHDHGEEARAVGLLDRLERDGSSLAVVSDAGTPCVADPGYRLVRLAKQRGIKVHPIPGASAVTSLVSASGLASNRFTFVGFLPTKAKEIDSEVRSWRKCGGSIVFFQPTRRLEEALEVIGEIYPQAMVAIGRELTKLYEEIVTVPVEEAKLWVQSHSVLKGEAVVMVELPEEMTAEQDEALDQDVRTLLMDQVRRGFAEGRTLKDLLKEHAGSGLSRSELYQLLLDVKSNLT